MRYSSDAHAPKSIILQRSEQKGRKGFPSHAASLPHWGHLNFFGVFSCMISNKTPQAPKHPGVVGWSENRDRILHARTRKGNEVLHSQPENSTDYPVPASRFRCEISQLRKRVLSHHQDHQAPFFTLGMKICSGSSTSWIKRSSSRVGGRVSQETRLMSRSKWHKSLISSGVLPGWQVSR